MPAELLTVAGEAALFANTDRRIDQQQSQQNAGAEATHKHVGNGGVYRNAVGNHRDTGWDDNAQTAGCRDQGHCKLFIIAFFDHSGHHDRTDRRGGGRTGTRDRAKEHTGDDRNDCKAASQMSDQRIKEHHQTLGKATAFHQRAGKDEERDRHQRERVAGGKQARGNVAHVDRSGRQHISHTGQTDGEADRNRSKDAAKKDDENNRCTHQLPPPSEPLWD